MFNTNKYIFTYIKFNTNESKSKLNTKEHYSNQSLRSSSDLDLELSYKNCQTRTDRSMTLIELELKTSPFLLKFRECACKFLE